MNKGTRVQVLKTLETGAIEHVHYVSSAGSCSVYISSITVLLDSGERINVWDVKLIKVIQDYI